MDNSEKPINGYKTESFITSAINRLTAWKKKNPYPQLFINCLNCGNPFKIRESEIGKKKYCSWECRTKFMQGQNAPSYGKGGFKTGQENPRFTGNPERERPPAEIKKWRRLVFYRDGYCCQRCKDGVNKRNNLNAHHIYGYTDFPALRFEVSNGITLCVSCHKWVHSKENIHKQYIGQ